MANVILRMDEYTLFEMLHAVAESSCGYQKDYDDKPVGISILHCCDYNETVHVLLEQIADLEFEDPDHTEYYKLLKKEFMDTLQDYKED